MNLILIKIRKFLSDNEIDQYLTKKYFDYGIVVISILFGFYLKWDMENVALFTFIIWIILNPVSSRLLAKIALAFLSFTPFLLILKRDDRAEQFAIFAYYFLVLTVIIAIIEFKKEQNPKTKLLAGKKK